MPDRSLLSTIILLLVSDSITRTVLAEKLEDAGYMVLSTGDLGQAVERLSHTSPDLLITARMFKACQVTMRLHTCAPNAPR